MIGSAKAIQGATNSLNKTIREIDAFLDGLPQKPSEGLRDELHEKLAELNRVWYTKGFNRGHIESRQLYLTTGKVPKRLNIEVKRELFVGKRRKIKLKSKA